MHHTLMPEIDGEIDRAPDLADDPTRQRERSMEIPTEFLCGLTIREKIVSASRAAVFRRRLRSDRL